MPYAWFESEGRDSGPAWKHRIRQYFHDPIVFILKRDEKAEAKTKLLKQYEIREKTEFIKTKRFNI